MGDSCSRSTMDKGVLTGAPPDEKIRSCCVRAWGADGSRFCVGQHARTSC